MGMLNSKKCRGEADDCRNEAARALDPADKAYWLKLAREWSELARRAELDGSPLR
jgi:hypothetical protein